MDFVLLLHVHASFLSMSFDAVTLLSHIFESTYRKGVGWLNIFMFLEVIIFCTFSMFYVLVSIVVEDIKINRLGPMQRWYIDSKAYLLGPRHFVDKACVQNNIQVLHICSIGTELYVHNAQATMGGACVGEYFSQYSQFAQNTANWIIWTILCTFPTRNIFFPHYASPQLYYYS